MTNAEKIRELNDLELALFLDRFNSKYLCRDICPYGKAKEEECEICEDKDCFGCPVGGDCRHFDYCEYEILKWLNEEIEPDSKLYNL